MDTLKDSFVISFALLLYFLFPYFIDIFKTFLFSIVSFMIFNVDILPLFS